MISRIHQKLGTAGFVISIVALVVAMSGAAYAAKGALTGKQKKEVEKIAKKYAGKPGAPGATGPAGPAGAAGPKGDTGAKGDAGSPGAEGEEGPQGKPGKQGSPWTAGGVLPSGETETGTFAYTSNVTSGQTVATSISFPIPLASGLQGNAQVHLVTADGSKEILENEATETWEEVTPTKCGSALNPAGTAASPEAAAGNLCVYVTKSVPAVSEHAYVLDPSSECEAFACAVGFSGPGQGTGVSGARFELFGSPNDHYYGYGTWAVTAP